jgi:DNA-binding NarL/FixJ family response regulator
LAGGTRPDSPLPLKLSPRERQVLALRASGWSADEIGRELRVSPLSVRVLSQNIMAKVAMHLGIEVTDDRPVD